MFKKFTSLILGFVMMCSMSLVAFATRTTAGGGNWDYGADRSTCWSYYTHPSLLHGATAINGDDESDDADGIDAGQQACARVRSTHWATHLFHRNRAYWHRCGMDKSCGYTQN